MRALGAKVTLQPVKVPHWVRGLETGELVDYRGRPAGISQRVVLTALGGSGATPEAGLRAEVIVVSSFEELKARASEVNGRIVLFDVPFDQAMADVGLAGQAYRQARTTASMARASPPRWARPRRWCARWAAPIIACRTPATPACRTARAFRRQPSRSRTQC
ncbi:hypothetical protein [Massilia sp. Dwa41.01b]|uniref:hypothetical protein n=1 Tax=Massilia sp. Dwa41.01b TaxID=2709302 RepID=UPI002805A1F0|nr:hypothetical protein [Massilia sp. Dwa41.01b]